MPETAADQDDDALTFAVAVIGSGPSAFYAAEALLKADGVDVRVDMFDRLPTPYGLVRGGVAPDHQKIKNVVRVYEKTAADPRFRFFGNVMLGRDLSADDLRAQYDRIIYAVGNESDRRLGVPGEDLGGVHAATNFVGWYNGHPDHQSHVFDLQNARRAVIVGNGNVAIDVARVLARDPDELAPTDIADEALAALRSSGVKEIVLLGRRGPAQAAFSPKEIAELAALEGVEVAVVADECELDTVSAEWLESAAPRSAKRNVAFLQEVAGRGAPPAAARCTVTFRFLLSPAEIVGEAGESVQAVRAERGELVADDRGVPRPRGLGSFEDVPADLVFKAVGYRGVAIDGVPFDEGWGTIPNRDGRVLDRRDGEVVPREYVVGWAKRGPTGLIGTNSPDSKETVAALLEDVAAAAAADDDDGGGSSPARSVEDLLRERSIDFVTLDDWRRLDAWELARGAECGKVRSKLTSIDSMLRVIADLRRRDGSASDAAQDPGTQQGSA